MPVLNIINRTAVRLPINSSIGILNPNENRTVELTANDLERSSSTLVTLAASGYIRWSVSPTPDDADNQLEPVLGGARVFRGAGSPESVVIGSVGDMYLRSDGGINTTLYVKETGNGTTTGWSAK